VHLCVGVVRYDSLGRPRKGVCSTFLAERVPAGGVVPVYRLVFDTVKVGGIELHAVEGVVIERGLDIALLGMSFLSRVEMKNEGQTMTLLRRF